MFPGWIQIALVVLLIVVLFGRGKISELMGDVAKGITSFKKGIRDENEVAETPKQIDQKAEMAASESKEKSEA